VKREARGLGVISEAREGFSLFDPPRTLLGRCCLVANQLKIFILIAASHATSDTRLVLWQKA
jgi:hypothetical protein